MLDKECKCFLNTVQPVKVDAEIVEPKTRHLSLFGKDKCSPVDSMTLSFSQISGQGISGNMVWVERTIVQRVSCPSTMSSITYFSNERWRLILGCRKLAKGSLRSMISGVLVFKR